MINYKRNLWFSSFPDDKRRMWRGSQVVGAVSLQVVIWAAHIQTSKSLTLRFPCWNRYTDRRGAREWMCALYHHNPTAVTWFSHYCFTGLRHPVPHRRQRWRVNHKLHQEATSSTLLKGARCFPLCEMEINWYEVFKRWDCWPMFLSKVWYHTCECTCTCSHTHTETHMCTHWKTGLFVLFCFYLD